eukprot:CAMPEP_0194286776 /NCGR_PEP_ID=MMETSP0169-20130528/33275_1 /TAXON_ID=218684 /ORGANISM="Corethron pennatum, Strain L29A3" /LENGTH=203 /DNA_ID=CAMNT_0039033289 /DNA_START=37 /DNA_END=645 /DNA_ORIENTATION=+
MAILRTGASPLLTIFLLFLGGNYWKPVSSFSPRPAGGRAHRSATELAAGRAGSGTRNGSAPSERRRFVRDVIAVAAATALAHPAPAVAADGDAPKVTSKVFIDFKGIPAPGDDDPSRRDRLVIGLYGDLAPGPVQAVLDLCNERVGLAAKCLPLDDSRILQREMLEARKVYNSCLAAENDGVTYDLGLLWRVDAGRRIDVGSV